MTEKQKQEITQLRAEGKTYSQIAGLLGLSVNTVKSYCLRNNIAGGTPTRDGNSTTGCKQCNGNLIQTPGAKPRKFCSPVCRSVWWAAHPHEIKQKAIYHFTCKGCGIAFSAYGNRNRKFCSHACYINHRFGGADDD